MASAAHRTVPTTSSIASARVKAAEGAAPWIAAPLQRDARVDRPDEERAEQQHAARVAVRDQMGERPQRHRGEQRVAQPAADLGSASLYMQASETKANHISVQVTSRACSGGDPDLIPGVGAVADEAPDDQRQAELRRPASGDPGRGRRRSARPGARGGRAGWRKRGRRASGRGRARERTCGFLQAAPGAMA